MADRVYINGVELGGVYLGDDFDITFRLNEETRTVQHSVSSEVSFRGVAFEFLESVFFSDPDVGCEQEVEVVLEFECCAGEQLPFSITYETISSYCPQTCTITSNLQERGLDVEAYECLLNSIYWSPINGVTFESTLNTTISADRDIVRIQYCHTPTGLLANIFGFWNSLVQGAADAIGVIPIVGDAIAAAILLLRIDLAFISCGRRHLLLRLGKIIEWSMERCGLEFKSNTILSVQPYSLIYLLQAQYKEGVRDSDPTFWQEENAANLNFIQLIEALRPVFNADYRIRDGVFCFERSDVFLRGLQSLGNIDELYRSGQSENEPCYAFVQERQCAYGRFEYAQDSQDFAGNRVTAIYNDIVDFNTPERPLARGACTVTVPFSPANFAGMLNDIEDEDIADDPNDVYTGRLWLPDGVSTQLKLIIPEFTSIFSGESLTAFGGDTDNIGHIANHPLWFRENLLEQAPNAQSGELYNNFHFTIDPRNNPCPIEVEEFVYVPENFCEAVALVREYGTDLKVETVFGDMKPEEVVVSFSKNTITLRGLRTFRLFN